MLATYIPIPVTDTNSFNACIQRKLENPPLHYHSAFELNYMLIGKSDWRVGNRTMQFSENDLLLMGPNFPHQRRPAPSKSTPVSHLVIQWHPDLLGNGWMEKKEFLNIKHLLALSNKGIQFSKKTALACKEKLIEIIYASTFEKIIKLLVLLQELAVSNSHQIICNDYQDSLYQNDKERLNIISDYLKEQYKKKITLSDMSSLLHISNQSFSRFFSRATKKPFFQFLNEYRIDIASKLLKETDLPINRVSYESGYENLSFFYRQFKRFKNCSPQYYRYNHIFLNTT